MWKSIASSAKSSLARVKDKALARILTLIIDQKTKGTARMINLSIDSNTSKIYFQLMLKGEKEPIEVNVGSYLLQQREGKTFIKLEDVSTSREWINALIENYLPQEGFEIPPQIPASLLKTII